MLIKPVVQSGGVEPEPSRATWPKLAVGHPSLLDKSPDVPLAGSEIVGGTRHIEQATARASG